MTKHCELRESAIILCEGLKLMIAGLALVGFLAMIALGWAALEVAQFVFIVGAIVVAAIVPGRR